MAEAERVTPASPEEDADVELELTLLLEAIFVKYRYDFRDYARASLKRRLLQLLPLLQLHSLSGLQEQVIHNAHVFSAVLNHITIPTTEMFRDPGYFIGIRSRVLPELNTYPSLKIWVAGCSTGEEVYSLAILLHEEGMLGKSLIYATDISPVSLRKAQEAIYPIDDIRRHTASYQAAGGRGRFSDYYTANYGSALIQPFLRRNIVFSDHSLATDQVFSETHFVSCRNVLIYFDMKLQNRALGLFHDSLVHGGFLGLGQKETLKFSDYEKRFTPVIPEEKIYQKRTL